MPRARSPDSLEAEKLYREGVRLVDIAKKLGVPSGTVRRWKSTQNWDDKGEHGKKKQSERSETEKANVRKKTKRTLGNKKGAPKGNQNAVGHGAPKGNQNAYKHGGYTQVYMGVLTDEEMEMVHDIPTDEEALLQEQLHLLTVQEVRLIKALNQYSEAKAGQYIEGVSVIEDKRSFKNGEEELKYDQIMEEKVRTGKRLPGQKKSVQTNTGASIDVVIRLQRELTAVQSKKTKVIMALSKCRMEKAKMESESAGNVVADNWLLEVVETENAETDE